MLSRRRRGRNVPKTPGNLFIDRPVTPLGAAAPSPVPALTTTHATLSSGKAATPVIPSTHVAVRVVWRGNAQRAPVLASSHDGWLHHKMMAAPASDGGGFVITLSIPRGVAVSYKFLVDGVWRTDPNVASGHPISRDGKVHNVAPVFSDGESNSVARDIGTDENKKPQLQDSSKHHLRQDSEIPYKTAQTGALNSRTDSADVARYESPAAELSRGSSFSGVFGTRHATRKLHHYTDADTASEMDWRQSSRNGNGTSGFASAARRSVLMRMGGARWRARLGVPEASKTNTELNEHVDPCSRRGVHPEKKALEHAPVVGDVKIDVNPGGIFNSSVSTPELSSGTGSTLWNSVPINCGDVDMQDSENITAQNNMNSMNIDVDKLSRLPGTARESTPLKRKEGSSKPGKHRFSPFEDFSKRSPHVQPSAILTSSSVAKASPAQTTPSTLLKGGKTRNSSQGGSYRTQARGGLRASSRKLQKVVVSGPTRVDEPLDADHVHRTAQNWREMARHLQDDLKDPVGARQLLHKAIEHHEKHGLWATFENAQVHIDLARALSKANSLSETEFHLRTALRIYERVNAAAEHKADLVHYIAVVVDRQKKRTDAEALYRKALYIYKANRLTGDNVQIALKNLALNLRKQNRSMEAEQVAKEHYPFDTCSATGG